MAKASGRGEATKEMLLGLMQDEAVRAACVEFLAAVLPLQHHANIVHGALEVAAGNLLAADDEGEVALAETPSEAGGQTVEEERDMLALQLLDEKARREQAEQEQEALEKEKKALEKEKRALNKEHKALEARVAAAFPQEWEIFQREYLTCPPAGRRLIERVFHGAATFEAFICNGAQGQSLPFVWDALRDAKRRGDQESEEALRAIFGSCLRLVNLSRGAEERYEMLTTKVGDEQDDETQSYAPESRAQGRVKEVILVGYRNNFNQKVERKSLVTLG